MQLPNLLIIYLYFVTMPLSNMVLFLFRFFKYRCLAMHTHTHTCTFMFIYVCIHNINVAKPNGGNTMILFCCFQYLVMNNSLRGCNHLWHCPQLWDAPLLHCSCVYDEQSLFDESYCQLCSVASFTSSLITFESAVYFRACWSKISV